MTIRKNRPSAKRKIWPLTNPITVAMDSAAALTMAQISRAMDPAEQAVRVLQFGNFGSTSWSVLADAFNIAEALAEQGIANDHSDTIQAAQDALGELAERFMIRQSWIAKGDELLAIKAAVFICEVQLNACSQAELERAIQRVRNRCQQALAGNAGAGVAVVTGAGVAA